MPDTFTSRSTEEQTRLVQRRAEAVAAYPKLFAGMAAAWNLPDPGDCAWLMYSANYALRTAGVLWAIDPLTMRWRVPEVSTIDVSHAFNQFDFVLLTHSHVDHLDFDLLKGLRHLPIRWVIPEYLLPQVQAAASLPVDQIIVPQPQQPIDIKGIHILPFEGQHFEEFPAGSGRLHGVPATAYLVEFNGKRWLFPGDTRNYRSELLPSFGLLDGMFAHVWLGRGSALLDEPPLLDQFCRFCTDFQPKRVVLTHLEEYGREVEDYWADRHALKVISHLEQNAPQISVRPAHIGDCVLL